MMSPEQERQVQKPADEVNSDQIKKVAELEAVLNHYINWTNFAEGWLSPSCRFELKLTGKISSRELRALVNKLQIDLETMEGIEFINPNEDRQ